MGYKGNIFKKIRENRGIFQNFVAKKIDISKEYLCDLEKDKKPMQLEIALKLLDFYAKNYNPPFTDEEKGEILKFMLGEYVAEQFIPYIKSPPT